jgi:hypothetical protein
MTERRYGEQEVAEIFRRATDTQSPEYRQPAATDGMTLAQLQEIGREVGIAPELVARAALVVDRPAPVTARRLLGFPIGVGRTVELGRELSDAEWDRLVVDLRETFDAKGKVSRDGALRQWTNGNLHAYIEPGENGQRLRMRTYNSAARMIMFVGGVYAGLGAFSSLLILAKYGVAPGRLAAAGVFAALGVGIAAVGALRLPGWARRRLAQMEGVAERLLPVGPSKPGDPTA